MKSFFEEYGTLVLVAVIVLALIGVGLLLKTKMSGDGGLFDQLITKFNTTSNTGLTNPESN